MTSKLGVDGNHSIIGFGLHPVFIEHIDTSAPYTSCVVVKIERVSVGQRLQLISELALGEIISRELICIEIEMLVHGNLHALSILVQQLYVSIVGSQSVVLRQKIRLIHIRHGLGPYTHLIARLAVRVVFLRSPAIPCDIVEIVCHRSGEADARQYFRQFALRTEMIMDFDRTVIVETIGIVNCESRQLHPLNVQVECPVG